MVLGGAARENQLTHAFRSAHDARRVHGFIEEILRNSRRRSVRQRPASSEVQKTLFLTPLNVAFHDWNVFVRCRNGRRFGTLAAERICIRSVSLMSATQKDKDSSLPSVSSCWQIKKGRLARFHRIQGASGDSDEFGAQFGPDRAGGTVRGPLPFQSRVLVRDPFPRIPSQRSSRRTSELADADVSMVISWREEPSGMGYLSPGKSRVMRCISASRGWDGNQILHQLDAARTLPAFLHSKNRHSLNVETQLP